MKKLLLSLIKSVMPGNKRLKKLRTEGIKALGVFFVTDDNQVRAYYLKRVREINNKYELVPFESLWEPVTRNYTSIIEMVYSRRLPGARFIIDKNVLATKAPAKPSNKNSDNKPGAAPKGSEFIINEDRAEFKPPSYYANFLPESRAR